MNEFEVTIEDHETIEKSLFEKLREILDRNDIKYNPNYDLEEWGEITTYGKNPKDALEGWSEENNLSFSCEIYDVSNDKTREHHMQPR